MSCCPCGLFKIQSNSDPDPGGQYRLNTGYDDIAVGYRVATPDDVREEQIVPLEPDSLRALSPDNELQNEADFLARLEQVSDTDGEVDAWQLQKLLNLTFPDNEFGGFSLDVCRGMVALGDQNLSGSLVETRELFSQLQTWKKAYGTYDTNNNGYIQADELNTLLEALDYSMDDRTLRAMTVRYSDNQHRIYFTEFVACMLKFTAMQDAYRYKQSQNDSTFSTDEFIQLAMYS